MNTNLVKVFSSANFGEVRTIVNEDGSISLNAEDVVKGLGWTTVAKSGNETIRWSRVNNYCREFGFDTDVTKDDYIPESLFYLLGMKASSSAAKEFQKWIAIDVLPQIRKTGTYTADSESMENEAYNLSPEIKSIFCLDKRTVELNSRIAKIENTSTIDYSQQEELRTLALKRVVSVLGGKNSPAYKELSKKAFVNFWNSYKQTMEVNSYRNTPVVKYEEARNIISNWQPDHELALMIKGANAHFSTIV